MDTDLRYPVGTFQYDGPNRDAWIAEIAALPATMRAAVGGLSDAQLDTPYRDGGWTVRQVVHHVFDSHVNSYIRWRWALTEDTPLIKAYDEVRWAELPDAKSAPIDVSLRLLDALHERWVMLLRSLSEEQWARGFVHPENGDMSLDKTLGLYAWHGRHHVAHITALRQRMNW